MDGSNDSHWLTQGSQTTITDLVREHADKTKSVHVDAFILSSPHASSEFVAACKTGIYIDNKISLHPIYRAIKNVEKGRKQGMFQLEQQTDQYKQIVDATDTQFCRQRTADQILRQGRFGFCSDKAILFRALMLAQGFSVSYLEVIQVDDFGSSLKEFKPHATNKVYGKETTMIYDPTLTRLFESETEYFDVARYVVVKEGLDSWDIGIRSKKDSERFLIAHQEAAEIKSSELHLLLEVGLPFV